jgi:hypothetical protein
VAATLATALALLVFVFARHSLSSAHRDPETAEKLLRLGSAIKRSVGRG